jgi:hypothetical protein
MKNPKNVTVGDIMRFYDDDLEDMSHRLGSTLQYTPRTYWLDEDDNQIPNGTCCVLVGYEWRETPEYEGYDFELLLPDGKVTRGWGEYAVEPVWSKKKSRKKWYNSVYRFG